MALFSEWAHYRLMPNTIKSEILKIEARTEAIRQIRLSLQDEMARYDAAEKALHAAFAAENAAQLVYRAGNMSDARYIAILDDVTIARKALDEIEKEIA